MAKVTLENITQYDTAAPGGGPGRFRDLNIEIPDNQFLVILGPSGCGKSSLLRMIAGLESPASGEIAIGDKNVKGVPPKDRDVALIFPNATLLPHLTANENMAFGLSLRRLTKAETERRAANASGLLDLAPLLDLRPDGLSPAQRLRVAIGRAVVRQPKVFLFDDPLFLLSQNERGQMRPLLINLHHHLQSTMIYVTSDPREAMALGGRLVVLGEGKPTPVEQTGTPLEIYNSPANRFVAGFASDLPMNFLNGHLRKDGEQIVFKEPTGGTLDIRLGSRTAAEGWIGKDVVLGLRPEDCAILPEGKAPQENAFQVLADIVETFGADTHFHADTGAHKLLISSRCAIDPEGAGRRIRIQINAAKAHLFDPSSGKAIR